MSESKGNPSSGEVFLEIVLAEIRGFREDNAAQHQAILEGLSTRIDGIGKRTRSLEMWRAWFFGVGTFLTGGAGVTVVARWIVSKFTGD